MRRSIAVAFVCVLLAGCAAQGGAREADLAGTYWRPIEIAGRAIAIHPGTREPHLLLDGGRVQGYSGCNTVNGSYVRSGASLRFGKLLMTRRACLPESGNALERAFVEALEATVSYRVSGEKLELIDASGATRMSLAARDAR